MNSTFLTILLLAVSGFFLTPIYGTYPCTTSDTHACMGAKQCIEEKDGVAMMVSECKPENGQDTVCCFWNKT
ncbi:unnamed protein product [Diamesa hyperborea]